MLANTQNELDGGLFLTLSESQNFYHYTNISSHDLLAVSGEREIFRNMQSHSLALFAILANSDKGMNYLIEIITEMLDERNTVASNESSLNEFDAAEILSLIDEIETIFYVNDQPSLRFKKRKLLAKIAAWGPPAYLVINKLFSRRLSDLDELSVRSLKLASNRYVDARNQMATSNLRLVLSIASKYKNLGTQYDDLVQEGYIGLIKAIERFDYRLGFRFSTYAYRAIGQNIYLAVHKNSSLVRKPFNKMKENRVIEQSKRQLEQKLGRRPTLSDVAEYISMPLDTLNSIVDSQQISAVEPKSEDHEVMDYLFSQGSPSSNTDLTMENSADFGFIEHIMSGLKARDRLIIQMRFGIGCRKDHTLEEIAMQIGLTKERVRQIVNTSIEKIKRDLAPSHEVLDGEI